MAQGERVNTVLANGARSDAPVAASRGAPVEVAAPAGVAAAGGGIPGAGGISGAGAGGKNYRVIEAIRRGERCAATVHAEVARFEPVLRVKDFSLWYGKAQALHGVSLDIPRGKVTAIIGPSGCGKSTLLRSVNRLNDLVDNIRYGGDMLLNGESVYDARVDVIDLRKRLGMVFQKPNPFPKSN